MKNNYLKLFGIFLMWVTTAQGQLSNFTLQVTPVHEVCAGQGTLNFQVSGTTPGAAISYTVYLLPNTTTPVAAINTPTLTGLVAGTYLVVATQTLGNQSNSQQTQVVIQNQIVPLAYTLSPVPDVCNLGGRITVNVTQGTAVGYEIIAGPVLVPLQTSNVFAGLPAGLYTIRVYDSCGEAVVQSHTLFEVEAGLSIAVNPETAVDCDTISVSMVVAPSTITAVAFPVHFHMVVYPATGNPIISDQTIDGPNTGETVTYQETVPYQEGEVFSYEVTVSDSCGNVQTITGLVDAGIANPTASSYSVGCDSGGGSLSNVTGAVLISGPPGYTGPVPYDFTSQIGVDNTLQIEPLAPGLYTFDVLGLCGQPSQLMLNVLPPGGGAPPAVSVQEGCSPGNGTLAVVGQYTFINLMSGPAAFSSTYPLDLTAQANAGTLTLASLPLGNYVFQTDDPCGNLHTVNGNIGGYYSQTNANVIEHCGAFDLSLQHQTNGVNLMKFWLQKLNPVTLQWGHPNGTGAYVEGTIPSAFTALEIGQGMTYNLPYNGQFRILKSFRVFTAGAFGFEYCFEVLYEFNINPGPVIEDVYTFNCSPDVYDVGVIANGIAPLIYRITHMNGQPFAVTGSSQGIFTGLSAANYMFQVEDDCGNIVNMLFDVPSPVSMEISTVNLCPGQNGQFSVPYFPFLVYEWIKLENPGVVLSTNGVLEFSPFTATDAGTYQVHITSSLALSCVDITLTYTIDDAGLDPQSGVAQNASLCTRNVVDLFTMLGEPYSPGGTWTSADGQTLDGSLWNTSALGPGVYAFEYSVIGLCSEASTQVEVTLMDAPAIPLVTVNFGCEGESLHLTAESSPGAFYLWTGPNGFTSTQANLTVDAATPLMNGTYTVVASTQDCSAEPVSIEVNILPGPQANLIAGCSNKRFVISVDPVSGFDPEDAIYTWSGPNGFTSAANPVDVTGNGSGTYSVVIETPDGCSTTASVEVAGTACVFPLAISPDNDGLNDDYDLSAFDVRKLQIFNRYGVTVYEKEGYVNQWRGQDYKDRPLPAGAYYYLAYLNSGGFESGWVYVNRRH